MRPQPVGDAALHRGDGGEMKAAADASQRVAHRGRIGHVAFDQCDARRQVLAPAGGQVVQHAHRIAACQQRLAQMRADEARAAGHQPCGHAPSSALPTNRTPSCTSRSRASSIVVRPLPSGTPMPRQASSMTTTS